MDPPKNKYERQHRGEFECGLDSACVCVRVCVRQGQPVLWLPEPPVEREEGGQDLYDFSTLPRASPPRGEAGAQADIPQEDAKQTGRLFFFFHPDGLGSAPRRESLAIGEAGIIYFTGLLSFMAQALSGSHITQSPRS